MADFINPFKPKKFNIYDYWEKNKMVGRYGVPYLDKELLGISKTDLVLIGARSGAGKSSLARIIYNANDKAKTALFSLEDFDGSVESSIMRKEYNIITESQYSIREWQTKTNIKIDENALKMAQENMEKQIGNSFIFGRVPPEVNQDSDEEGWNIKALTDKIAWCATHGIELIIIDHLDYLDRDNPNESDIAHITELMKAIRKAQELGSAIVAFSHLRKFAGSKNETVVPNEDEFIGSSNKVKQATQVILLAPEYKQQDNNCGTWCCIRKNRYGGIKYQAAKMFFNPLTETYNQNYEMFNINYSGTKAEQIDKTGLQTINKTSI